MRDEYDFSNLVRRKKIIRGLPPWVTKKQKNRIRQKRKTLWDAGYCDYFTGVFRSNHRDYKAGHCWVIQSRKFTEALIQRLNANEPDN